MSPVYSRIRRSLLYIVFTLIGAFAIASFVLVSQESKIDEGKERNAQFHMPSILLSANAAKLILRSREQLLITIGEFEHESEGEPHTPHLQPALGYQPLQVIRNDFDQIMELHGVFGGSRYQATLDKIVDQYERFGHLERSVESNLAGSILSIQEDLDRLDELYLSFNQLERLHTGSYEELNSLIESQVARRNLVGIPVSIIIMLGALAIIAFLASQTRKALGLQERSDHELQALNKQLEQRIIERTKSLSQSRETYKALFEQAPIAYYNVGPDGAIRRWNKAAERFFGVSGEDMKGRNVTELYHPTSLDKAEHMLARFSAGLDWNNEEMTYVRPDGGKSYGLLSVAPIFDDDGNVIESLSMDVDISELREARDKVSTMQQELLVKERLAAIGQLTATVSHELRNPLGAIRGATDALRQLVSDENKHIERAFALLERGQVRCDKIIGDLLDYTRVQDLRAVGTKVDSWLTTLLDDCGIPSEIDVRLELGFQSELDFDRERMEQAVRNVVDNACHAMKNDAEGGTSDDRQELTVTTRQVDQRFELSIRDTGCGIEQDLQTKVFEPLFTTKSFGVGLGLPMVQRIMDQHGGGITISGSPGRGTETILWIPVAAENTIQ